MQEQIITGAITFGLGYLACFYHTLFMQVKMMKKKLHDLQAESHLKISPNKVFIDRYGDRRKPDQSWSEQVSQAHGVGSKRPVLVRKVKVWGPSKTWLPVGKED